MVTLTPRLQKCLDVGSSLALFPILSEWTQDELKALVEDADAYGIAVQNELAEMHGKIATRPENFFSAARSKAIDTAAHDAELNVMAVCSEIIAVALCYLDEDKIGGLDL